MNALTLHKINPIGALLGLEYLDFSTEYGVVGLIRREGDSVDVLAVAVSAPGTGQFRRFVQELQAEFKVIVFSEVINPVLGHALGRYGFKRVWCAEDSGQVQHMMWSRGDTTSFLEDTPSFLARMRDRAAALIHEARRRHKPKPAYSKGRDDRHYRFWRKWFDPNRDGVVQRQRGKHEEG